MWIGFTLYTFRSYGLQRNPGIKNNYLKNNNFFIGCVHLRRDTLYVCMDVEINIPMLKFLFGRTSTAFYFGNKNQLLINSSCTLRWFQMQQWRYIRRYWSQFLGRLVARVTCEISWLPIASLRSFPNRTKTSPTEGRSEKRIYGCIFQSGRNFSAGRLVREQQ